MSSNNDNNNNGESPIENLLQRTPSDIENVEYGEDVVPPEGTCTRTVIEKLYPTEWVIFGYFPAGRTVCVVLWLYILISNLVYALRDVCTYGVMTIYLSSLSLYSIFFLYGVLQPKPYPLTFAYALKEGCNEAGASFYLIFQSIIVLIVICLFTINVISSTMSLREFFDWQC